MSSSQLRVLFVGVKWPPETFLARLVRGLAARGHQITLAVTKEPDARWQSTPNVDFLYTPSWSGSRLRRVFRTGYQVAASTLRSPSETAHLVRTARQSEIGHTTIERLYRWTPFIGREWDVIYFPWNATAITHLHLMDRAPSVISCRGSQINVSPNSPDRMELREGLPLTFDKASAVHCVSEAIREEAALYGLDRAKAVVIRPAVDPDVFCSDTPDRPAGETLRVVITGSIIWRKGYEYALMAIDRLQAEGIPVHLDIIGNGDEVQRLLYTIHDLKLDEAVTWHGHLPPNEVMQRLQQSDVFLLASLSEGISNAVLEAMACGLPVVTTDIGGMNEAISNGVEGLLVPPRDVDAIANALRCLWQYPELRRRMGVAGRTRVVRDFPLTSQITAFEKLFRSVA